MVKTAYRALYLEIVWDVRYKADMLLWRTFAHGSGSIRCRGSALPDVTSKGTFGALLLGPYRISHWH